MGKRLEAMVDAKLCQWEMEALLFCAQHGRNGGTFSMFRWANGKVMAEAYLGDDEHGAVHGRANQAITLEQLNELRRNNWTIFCGER